MSTEAVQGKIEFLHLTEAEIFYQNVGVRGQPANNVPALNCF